MGIYGVMMGAAVVAVVLLGMVSLFQGVMTSQRTQTVMQTLTVMEASIRRSYANMAMYDSQLTAGVLSQVPRNAIQGTGTGRTVVTPWGGSIFAGGGVTVDLAGVGTPAAGHRNRFYITVLELPEAACETIGKAYLNNSGVVSVAVEGDGTAATTPQTTAAAIDLECDGADNDTVGIVFRG